MITPSRPAGRRWAARGPAPSQEPQQRPQDHQRVHPGRGGVVDGERRGGDQQDEWPRHRAARRAGGRPSRRTAAPPPTPRPKGPDGDVALAEDEHPEVEQHVVQRRGAVVAEGAGDLAERQLGDVDGQGLVQPEVGTVQNRRKTPMATMSPAPMHRHPRQRRSAGWWAEPPRSRMAPRRLRDSLRDTRRGLHRGGHGYDATQFVLGNTYHPRRPPWPVTTGGAGRCPVCSRP